MREREKSSISRPWTISQAPSRVVTGKDEISPSGTPYEPSEATAIDTQSPSAEPSSQSRAASIVADAAEAAEEEPRASMIAAPRLATVGMKSSSIQDWSPTTSAALRPPISAWKTSGYCVAEWLPQIVIFLMSETEAPVFAASCEIARLWSRRGSAPNPAPGGAGGVVVPLRALGGGGVGGPPGPG